MYRKKGRGWTKHIDFMLLDVLCMQIAFIVSYIWRFGPGNPYTDKDYRILAAAFLLIDFFVEIVSDAFKNVLKRGYLDELIATCKHVVLVEILTTFFLFTTQMGEIYSRMSYYIMIPIYILVSYLGRVVLKKIIKKRSFASSKKSLFVIAPEKLLEETLHGLKENGFGYTQIVAAATDADLKGKTICEIPIVANHDGIVEYACEEWVDEVLIPPCAEIEYPYEMADIFLEMGIAVHRGITRNKAMAGSLGVNYNKIVSLKKEQKKVFGVIFGAILILMAIYLYNNILINIKTYAYRMRGFQNLLDYMLDDSKRLMFGISDIAYADNGNTYVNNIRSFLGWEASVEMAHVNILIKNGLLGVFPYIMIYKSYISEKKYLNSVDKSILLALIILMLISGFVETYIVSIHYVVGPVLYCLVNGIISQKDKQEIKENEN